LPYWIFKAFPRLFPQEFQDQGYEHFGFDEDDHQFYSKEPLPRGLALCDTTLELPLFHMRIALKRVAINCSGCHRGEYTSKGGRFLVDGMPNHTADLQAFKTFVNRALRSPTFTPDNVINAIDSELSSKGTKLDSQERFVYARIVEAMRLLGSHATDTWMDHRPPNGPGRIDPFNAVKFEVLGLDDDGTAATLDFPAIWNQRPANRPWHHYDGNTASSSARNFGSVIGVGGISMSVNKELVRAVGEWIDWALPSPEYPFGKPDPAAVEHGRAIFQEKCIDCHGSYDRATRKMDISQAPRFMSIIREIDTDPERWKAFSPAVAKGLDDYGDRRQLWADDAFRGDASPGYLAGPLDGLWARAPYLHNGSVPNIDQLLHPPSERTKKFVRGATEYDDVNMGFVSDENPVENAVSKTVTPVRRFVYDTTLPGNSNQGHDVPVPSAADRRDLIAYLKTL
jgi:mono/diheme cytochrome c family protein